MKLCQKPFVWTPRSLWACNALIRATNTKTTGFTMSQHLMMVPLQGVVVVVAQQQQVQEGHLVLLPHDSWPGHMQILG